jgi:hypothetical protein
MAAALAALAREHDGVRRQSLHRRQGLHLGRLGCSHGITTDQLGNLYLADCFAGRVQKFEPLPGADPDKLAGQIVRTWDTWKPN